MRPVLSRVAGPRNLPLTTPESFLRSCTIASPGAKTSTLISPRLEVRRSRTPEDAGGLDRLAKCPWGFRTLVLLGTNPT
jgi:hypothetical protein